MTKKNNKQIHHNKKAMPKTDVEFAANGLEKIALKAEKNQNK